MFEIFLALPLFLFTRLENKLLLKIRMGVVCFLIAIILFSYFVTLPLMLEMEYMPAVVIVSLFFGGLLIAFGVRLFFDIKQLLNNDF